MTIHLRIKFWWISVNNGWKSSKKLIFCSGLDGTETRKWNEDIFIFEFSLLLTITKFGIYNDKKFHLSDCSCLVVVEGFVFHFTCRSRHRTRRRSQSWTATPTTCWARRSSCSVLPTFSRICFWCWMMWTDGVRDEGWGVFAGERLQDDWVSGQRRGGGNMSSLRGWAVWRMVSLGWVQVGVLCAVLSILHTCGGQAGVGI